jgi:hypothetical protein
MKVKKTVKKSAKKETKSEEPMVKVIQVNVNPENPKNGFFELDWNDEFVNMLKQNGYTGESRKRSWIVGSNHCAAPSAMNRVLISQALDMFRSTDEMTARLRCHNDTHPSRYSKYIF